MNVRERPGKLEFWKKDAPVKGLEETFICPNDWEVEINWGWCVKSQEGGNMSSL